MRNIRIGKLTLNFGAGKDQAKLERGVLLLKKITGVDPVKTVTQKRIAAWGLRPGLPIGAKLTFRGKDAMELLPRLLKALDNHLKTKCFDNQGNVSFGVREYIDIDGVEYDPKIGIEGLEVCVTLVRPGFRIKNRQLQKKKLPTNHRITSKESQDFFAKNFQTTIGDED